MHRGVLHRGKGCEKVGTTRAQGPSSDTGHGDSADETEGTAARSQFLAVVTGLRGQQNREHEKHNDAAGINRNLHRAEKLIVELEIEGSGSKQGKKQVGRSAQDLAGGDSQYREDDNRQGDYQVDNDTSY